MISSLQHSLMLSLEYGSERVLDTGVWPERQSYNDIGLSSVPSHWKGECSEGQNFTKEHCNRKLVGARFFSKGPDKILGYDSPRDSEGHGTHTSSTAAGSAVVNASMCGYAPGTATGIAPKSRIAVYKVCWPIYLCDSVDIVAAYDKAIEDGVDIISFSIGIDVVYPYHYDPIAIAQFGAMEHNVLVSASGGNNGPSLGSVANIPPWIVTVGAELPKKRFFPLVYAGNLPNGIRISDAALCLPGHLNSKLVKGKIVVCERGGNDALKVEVVKNASGVGMVLANVGKFGESVEADATDLLPTLAIPELNVQPAPMVSIFSSRGPNRISDYVIKPDLVAPGADILAAWPDDGSPAMSRWHTRATEFNILSGTSMSCPHISGVAALLKGAHHGWSPSRIKSAMMTTSYVVDNAGNPLLDESAYNVSTPWHYGSGHVDPEKALDPGLVYDLTTEDYIDFLCASNYSQKDIAVITSRPVNFTRTATQVYEGPSSYTLKIENPSHVLLTVDPPVLEFSEKDQKVSYVVTISAEKFAPPANMSATVFGRITWQDGIHNVSMPVAVTQINV
ncbi:hypothetical protein IFM89_010643 [Coptis chinensis]|uniref:Uncharacterized protein n=1 Tax=Coptis chinensis TaxID=261450 RepID=A0A835IPM7_9MAGN|nr:hypothetical protein IFM89_010643 [Coptis chinensis]